jgi:hypothetical protein
MTRIRITRNLLVLGFVGTSICGAFQPQVGLLNSESCRYAGLKQAAIFRMTPNQDDELNSDSRNNNGREESSEPYYPPLTQSELENRKAEMLLIARLLSKGDKAIAEFKHHWFSERGEEAKATLVKADFNIGKGPDYWPEAEVSFLKLVADDPTFLEPKVRLSKLYCLQAEFSEAEKLSQQVLDSKPWHFVAIETMVAVSTAQGKTTLAELWKSRRLPNPSQAERRNEWVERALLDAEEILGRMQRYQE